MGQHRPEAPQTNPVAPLSRAVVVRQQVMCRVRCVPAVVPQHVCPVAPLGLGVQSGMGGCGSLKAAMSLVTAEPPTPTLSLPLALSLWRYSGQSGMRTRARALSPPHLPKTAQSSSSVGPELFHVASPKVRKLWAGGMEEEEFGV